jgi:quercetin dioxygenase-like cupin family protein
MSHFHQLETVPVHQRGGSAIKVVSGKDLMAFFVDVKAGTHVAAHRHPNEQITWLIAGRAEYRIGDGAPVSCGPGTIVHIPADVEHEVWYREDCRYCEMFSPPRLDLFPAAARHPYGIE